MRGSKSGKASGQRRGRTKWAWTEGQRWRQAGGVERGDVGASWGLDSQQDGRGLCRGVKKRLLAKLGLGVGWPPRLALGCSPLKALNASRGPWAGASTPGQVGECFPAPCMCGPVSDCQHVRGSPAWASGPSLG